MEEAADWFSLPTELLRMILQYLPLQDICKMDTAVTNHDMRPEFLAVLAGMTIIEYKSPSSPSKDSQKWLLLRDIYPLQLSYIKCSVQFPLLLRCKEVLTSLQLIRPLSKALPNFPSLRTLKINNLSNDCIRSLTILLSNNPQLEYLELSTEAPFDLSLLRFTPYLKGLTLSQNKWLNDRTLSPLLGLIRNLQYIDLTETQVHSYDTFRNLIKSCPDLHYISFGGSLSIEVRVLCYQSVVYPSLACADLEANLLGLQCAAALWVGLNSISPDI